MYNTKESVKRADKSVNRVGAICGFLRNFAVSNEKDYCICIEYGYDGRDGAGVTDVHSHIITPEFVSALEKEGRVLDEGFPLPKWDAEAQLKWMDEAGIQTSVLTLAAPQPQETHPPAPFPSKGWGSCPPR